VLGAHGFAHFRYKELEPQRHEGHKELFVSFVP
jgi:hypothetical protein